ncbi:LysR family transcriptional regulator [Ralstonia solanacearum]|nr:LysR family transcriptional regulator [Ralstonia solanacearum]
MTECATFFESNAGNKEKVKALQKIEQRFVWEKEQKASRLSPGTVQDDEIIYRQLHLPTHIDKETGELKPTAFDDICNKGLSSDRLGYTTKEDIIARGVARAEEFNKTCTVPEKIRSLLAVARLSAADIRSHKDGNTQLLGVYDTALKDNTAHCDVCLLVGDEKSKRSARAHLFTKHVRESVS